MKKRKRLPGGPPPKAASSMTRMHFRSPRDPLYEYERDEMQQAAKMRRKSKKVKQNPRSNWLSDFVKQKEGLIDPKEQPQTRSRREGPSLAERQWARKVFRNLPAKYQAPQNYTEIDNVGFGGTAKKQPWKDDPVTAVLTGERDENEITVREPRGLGSVWEMRMFTDSNVSSSFRNRMP